MMKNYSSINEYISTFTPESRAILQQMRKTIHKAAPTATETIRYGIPTFQLNGKNLVHFAAFSTHYGFYPTSSPIIVFRDELKKYEFSKGTIRFPLDSKIPYTLIAKMTKYRVQEEKEWAEINSKKKK